jgi:hypothetical protein
MLGLGVSVAVVLGWVVLTRWVLPYFGVET